MNWGFNPSRYTLAVCDNQGEIFEDIQDVHKKDPIDFITKFMNSKVAEHMDLGYTPFNNTGAKQLCEAFIDEGIEIKDLGTETLPLTTLCWVGYMYRYWAWMGMPSKEIIKITPVKNALYSWYGYHTLEVEEAIRKFIKVNKRSKK